jgi:hypothetical protein
MVKYLSFYNSSLFLGLKILFNVNGKARVWHTPCLYGPGCLASSCACDFRVSRRKGQEKCLYLKEDMTLSSCPLNPTYFLHSLIIITKIAHQISKPGINHLLNQMMGSCSARGQKTNEHSNSHICSVCDCYPNKKGSGGTRPATHSL